MSGWNWNTQNGDGNATQAEIIAAYTALTNRGRIADFHASVWKDIIAAVKQLRQDFGDTDWPTNFAHNEQSGNIITAASFMDVAHAIPLGKDKHWSWIDRVNRPALQKGDNVYGQYFLDLAAEIERKANMTLLHPAFDTTVLTDTDALVRLLQLLAVRGLLETGVTSETTMHLYSLLPTKLTDHVSTNISALVKKLLMLPTKATVLVPTHTDVKLQLLNMLNIDLGEIEHGYSHRVRIPLITLLEAILPPQDRYLDIETTVKLILRSAIGFGLNVGVSMTDTVRLVQLLRVKPLAAQHIANITASVNKKDILTLAGALTAQTGSTVSLHEKISVPVKYADTLQHMLRTGVHRLDISNLRWSDYLNTNIQAEMASIYAKSIGFCDSHKVDIDGYAWIQEPLTIAFQDASTASLSAVTRLLSCVPVSYTLTAQTASEWLIHTLSAMPMSLSGLCVNTDTVASAHRLGVVTAKYKDNVKATVTAQAHRRSVLPATLADSTSVRIDAGAVSKNIVFIGGAASAAITDQYTAHVLGLRRVFFDADFSAEMSALLKALQSVKVTADAAVPGTAEDVQIVMLGPVPVGATAQADMQITAVVQGANATRVRAADDLETNIACSLGMFGLTLLSELDGLTLHDLDAYSLKAMTHNNFLLNN